MASNIIKKKINFNRIFLLSDIHFGVRANSVEWLINQLLFFEKFYIPFLEENVKENDILFFLGDIFDNRQLIDINVMNKVIDIIYRLSKILPIHIMTGNHDIYKKNETDVNSLISFRFIPNVYIYENPSIITNDKSNILILPWIGDKKKEESHIYENHKNVDFIFAHTDLKGFKYDNGRNIIKGVDVSEVKVKKIFSGHIHKRQEHENIFYIGSPYHTKRSDIGNEKFVYVFNPNKNIIDKVKNNLSSVFQRIKLEDLLEWTLEYTSKILNNNYTDIIVPDKYVHLFNLTKFIELFRECNYKKIEAVGEKVKVDNETLSIIDGGDIKDILTLIEMSIDDLQQTHETLVKLKMLNKQYYKKASKNED